MKSISLLIKPVSSECNMRCNYCFYSDISDSRSKKNHGIMNFDILETIVKKALSEASEHCVFGFQGGEPTLAGLDFFRYFIELVARYNINNVKISHTIQTNGLLIDENWAEFFKKNKFLIGLSIDASKKIHDFIRLDCQGKGTHNRTLKAARLLTKHGADFNILSVVTQQLAAHPESAYSFYKQNGFRYMQFVPCIDGFSEAPGANAYSLKPERYGSFLCHIFDLWYTDYINKNYYSIRSFDNYILMLFGAPPESCAMRGVCSAYALIEADGNVYPCDFYAIDEFLLGNIAEKGFEELLCGKKANNFIEPSKHMFPSCNSCNYNFICQGGCRRDREPLTGGELSRNRYCESYKMFFEHALPRMAAIARTICHAGVHKSRLLWNLK